MTALTVRSAATTAILTVIFAISVSLTTAAAHADSAAYLVNVTVRPGHGFSSADQELAYGQGICVQAASDRRYGCLIASVTSDVGTNDAYQASYRITQASTSSVPLRSGD